MSCFKECGLDREFSYQQWESYEPGRRTRPGVGCPEGPEDVAAWSDHVLQLIPSSQCPEGCLSHREGHGYPLPSAGDESQERHRCSGPDQQIAREALKSQERHRYLGPDQQTTREALRIW